MTKESYHLILSRLSRPPHFFLFGFCGALQMGNAARAPAPAAGIPLALDWTEVGNIAGGI